MAATKDVPNRSCLDRLHFVPVGGIAGDMILAALIDLGADLEFVVKVLESLAEPNLVLSVQRVAIDGENACYVRSLAPSEHHQPRHRHLAEVQEAIHRASMTAASREIALRVFDILVNAEARAHDTTPDEVHLHEVGELDSIMDVVGICAALDSLGMPRITCEPLPSGSGTVDTSHGVLDCPVPAVREIAKAWNVPLVDVEVQGETITPTGIAILAATCDSFDEPRGEDFSCQGAGAGTRRFPERPNLLHVFGWSAAPCPS